MDRKFLDQVFEYFDKEWALVTSGPMEDFNGCTLGWGGLGNLWNAKAAVTIYVHPDRYTSEYLIKNDYFTLSFFDREYRKALSYMGSHSGRDESDKAIRAGLTPIKMGETVGYGEAKINLLCRKIYSTQIKKEDLVDSVQDYYAKRPKVFPDYKGGWQAHFMFIGEVIEILEKDKDYFSI